MEQVSDDGEFIDREGYPIFMYTLRVQQHFEFFEELLLKISKIERTDRTTKNDSELVRPKKVLLVWESPGNITALVAAMMVSSSEIVSLLLEHGADPYECDIAGNDAAHVCIDFWTHGQRQVLAEEISGLGS